MSGQHFVELEGNDDGGVTFRFVCEAPEGAPCRMVWTCECDEGHSGVCEERYPDGPPLVDLGECNHALLIENSDGVEWSVRGGIARIPVTTENDGGTYWIDFDKAAVR